NEYLRLKQSSGVDVKQEIVNTIEKHSQKFSVKETLNSASIDNYMYPSKYNDEREMTRYFSFEFIDESEVTGDVDWEVKGESIEADGIIYGIIPESEESIPKIKELLLSTSKGQERFIFILPRKYMEINEIVLQFNAVMELRSAAEGNDLLFDEYEVIYEDLRDVISEFIGSYTRPENFKSIYIHGGIEQMVTRKAGLTGLMSQICEKIYARTPIINNEAVNKNELSGAAYTSRNKIIAGLLRNTLEPGLGFTGTGQEVSIMRSTLVRKNILVEEGGVTRINLKTGDGDLDHMLGVISGFFQGAKRKGICEFKQLYYDLMSPRKGIGIRKSLIPVYLAAVLHEYRQEAVIINNAEQIPLNLDALLQIEADPSQFQLQYLDWDPEKEDFIRELDDIFHDYVIGLEKTTNAYEYVVSAMKRWYMALPKYSKEKTPQGKEKRYKGLIRLLKQNIGSYEFLFVKLPDEFGQQQFSVIIADTVKLAKEYYDRVLDDLIEKLIESIKELFLEGTGCKPQKRSSLASIIKDWCESLDNSVFEQLFENGANRFIGLLKEVTNDERTFITRLAKLVTGLRLEDWEEKTVTEFEEKLREYKETAEEFNGGAVAEIGEETSAYSLTYIDDTGKNVTKRFDRVEQSKRGKLLMNSLLADIESMGHAVPEQEKRQILMEVLKKLC
ncbi:MAG: restriction endonuclease subunit S, partial [Eubacterium sp.]|nr:restriction endonuclease subunit S [Eubacterium sp.]